MNSNQNNHKYPNDAFISYSSHDLAFASELQQRLEKGFFRLDKKLRGERKKLIIIRDRDDFDATGSLSNLIKGKLEQSKNLIVICSPNSINKSKWVNVEIEYFVSNKKSKLDHTDGSIIPILYQANDPINANDFPKALVNDQEVPLAIDFRKNNKNQVFTKDRLLRVYAGILDIPYSTIIDRQRKYEAQIKRRNRVIGLLLLLFVLDILVLSFIYSTKPKFELVKSNPIDREKSEFFFSGVSVGNNTFFTGNDNGDVVKYTDNNMDTLHQFKGLVSDMFYDENKNSLLFSSMDTNEIISYNLESKKLNWSKNLSEVDGVESIQEMNGKYFIGDGSGILWKGDEAGNFSKELESPNEEWGRIMDLAPIEKQNTIVISYEDEGFFIYNLEEKKLTPIDLPEELLMVDQVSVVDEKYIIMGSFKSGSNNPLWSYNLETGTVFKLDEQHGQIASIITIPNTAFFLTSNWKGDIKFWDADKNQLLTSHQIPGTDIYRNPVDYILWDNETQTVITLESKQISFLKLKWIGWRGVELPSYFSFLL